MMKRVVWVLVLTLVAAGARASEIGHFSGAFFNIRDYFVPPEPGFYAAVYNYHYSTDRLNDENGDDVGHFVVGPGAGVPVNVDVDVDLFAVSPAVLYASDWKVLGARYAAIVAPSFSNASLNAKLNIGKRIGGELDNNEFALGDMLVQPLWLGWSFGEHVDVSAAYAFYAATGKYDTEVKTGPLGNPVRVESIDNIGYGFWTHQGQVSVGVYPFDSKGTVVVGAMTYEYHTEKEDFDLQPGENITLNYGISQFVPLTSNQHLLLELGPAGYHSFQVSADRGSDAVDRNRDRVHAVGGQIGFTYVPWVLGVNFHGFYEYSTYDRFQGTSLVLSLAKKF